MFTNGGEVCSFDLSGNFLRRCFMYFLRVIVTTDVCRVGLSALAAHYSSPTSKLLAGKQ